MGLLVLATAAFPFRIRSLLKLLTSLALLLEELQHIQHRGAPQSETQLTIAKALRSCVRRANKGRPAICDHSFGMKRSSRRRAPAKHDRSPCAPQSLETWTLMVWRSQAVHFAVQKHDALERRTSAETALENICETLVVILITTHNDLAGIPDGIDHRHIPSSNIHDFERQSRHPADWGWRHRRRRWWRWRRFCLGFGPRLGCRLPKSAPVATCAPTHPGTHAMARTSALVAARVVFAPTLDGCSAAPSTQSARNSLVRLAVIWPRHRKPPQRTPKQECLKL